MNDSSKLLKEQRMHDVALAYTLYDALKSEIYLEPEQFMQKYQKMTVDAKSLLEKYVD